MFITQVAKDWHRLDADLGHRADCMLLGKDFEVPQTDAQYTYLLRDWNTRATPPSLPIDFKQASEQGGWLPIASAPKSRDAGEGRIEGAYLLGFCPEPDMCNLESAVCVVWWEPLMNKGKGMWYGEGGFETHPTHWQPLPAAPTLQGVADGDAVGGKAMGGAA